MSIPDRWVRLFFPGDRLCKKGLCDPLHWKIGNKCQINLPKVAVFSPRAPGSGQGPVHPLKLEGSELTLPGQVKLHL